jgi:NAD(P)-dependent dehydrogenase (short-subunit alcohol dehydrogenase family)
MSNLNEKVAMVTGAASGIGRASSLIMARRGARLMITDVDAPSAQAVVDEISSAGGEAAYSLCDITQPEQIEAAIAATVSRFGRIDVLHNNAALVTQKTLEEDTDILTIGIDTWDAVFAANVRGTMLGCRFAVREMLKTGGGSIINTSSMYGIGAFVRMPAYSVSKAAINSLTQMVATRWGREGIRCNAVAPSVIMTPLVKRFLPEELIRANRDSTLTGWLGEPEDVGNVVAFLASDDARYLTGQIYAVDGGTTAHLPTYADARRVFGDAP